MEKGEGREPTVEEISKACQELLGAEVAEDFKGLELEEAIGYAYTLLIAGGHDPDDVFRRRGIIIEEENSES